MQEIKCPNCGQVFQVDESGYAQIVQQVRDREFEKELERRQQEMARQKESDLTVAKMRQEQQHRAALPGASARGKDHREDQCQTNNAFFHLPLRLFFSVFAAGELSFLRFWGPVRTAGPGGHGR